MGVLKISTVILIEYSSYILKKNLKIFLTQDFKKMIMYKIKIAFIKFNLLSFFSKKIEIFLGINIFKILQTVPNFLPKPPL